MRSLSLRICDNFAIHYLPNLILKVDHVTRYLQSAPCDPSERRDEAAPAVTPCMLNIVVQRLLWGHPTNMKPYELLPRSQSGSGVRGAISVTRAVPTASMRVTIPSSGSTRGIFTSSVNRIAAASSPTDIVTAIGKVLSIQFVWFLSLIVSSVPPLIQNNLDWN